MSVATATIEPAALVCDCGNKLELPQLPHGEIKDSFLTGHRTCPNCGRITTFSSSCNNPSPMIESCLTPLEYTRRYHPISDYRCHCRASLIISIEMEKAIENNLFVIVYCEDLTCKCVSIFADGFLYKQFTPATTTTSGENNTPCCCDQKELSQEAFIYLVLNGLKTLYSCKTCHSIHTYSNGNRIIQPLHHEFVLI